MSGWRVAVRVARRSSWRHRRRSALVLLLLFVPACAATILVTAWANLSGTSAQETTFAMGAADLIVTGDDPHLPAGSRTTPLTQGRTIVRTPGGDLAVRDYEATDLDDPLNRGRYVRRAGRAPRGPAEVAVTTATHLRLGESIEAGRPARRLTVVGVFDAGSSLRAQRLVVAPGAPLSADRPALMVAYPPGRSWSPPPSGVASSMERTGMGPTPQQRAVQAAATLLIGVFAAAQTVLLTGAAFLVSAERQRRELAVIAAAGATRRQLRRIALAGGLLLGVAAAAGGALLGLGAFRAARPLVERAADHPLIDVAVPYGRLLAVAAATVAVGALAALLPVRRPGPHSGRRPNLLRRIGGIGPAGLAALALGCVLLVTNGNPDGRIEFLALGGLLLLLGVAACAPAGLRLCGGLAARLPLTGRIAVRHAIRHRLRTGAAIAAVAAAVAGSVALALVGAARGDEAPAARPGQVILPGEAAAVLGPDGLRRFAAALPARQTVELHTVPADPAAGGFAQVPEGGVGATGELAVGGAEVVRLVTGRAPTEAETRTLAGGGAVAFDDRLLLDGRVQAGGVLLPAVRAGHTGYVRLPSALITPATATRLRLTAQTTAVVVDTTRPPTRAELAAADTVLLAAANTPMTAQVAATSRPTALFVLLAALSGAVTLVAATVAVGLSTVELGADLATMAAIGATLRVRRRVNAANAALITGLGALLGLAAGVGPAAGYVGYSVSVGWRVPWAALLGIVVVPPVLAVAVAAVLLTPRDRPLRLTLRGSAGPPAPAGGLRFPAAGRAW